MNTILRTILMTGVATIGCTGEGRKEAPGLPHDAGAKDEPHEEKATPGVVRIDPAMLGDLRVTTSRAESRRAGDGATLLGELRVNEDAFAEVGVQRAARVTTVLAALGERVRAGQALAVLETADLGRARGDVLLARTRVELARALLKRKRVLATEKVAPLREIEEASADLAMAEAKLFSARASLGAFGVTEKSLAAEGRATRWVVRSPIAGAVLERNVVRGQYVEPSRALFRVGDLSRLWLVVQAFERDAVRIALRSVARVSLPALPGRTIDGTVALIGLMVDPRSRTTPVRIDVKNDDGVLRPGMSASAWVPLGTAKGNILAIPAAALQRVADGWSVFVPKGEGAFEIRAVGRGRDLRGEVEIVSGLKPGENVVVGGAFLLKAEADKSRSMGEHHEH
jgi:cobalt-zinc-cadmium efflux system membrane fusion protein